MPDDGMINAMLFNHETTLKTDFRGGDVHPPILTKYNKKKDCLRVRPPEHLKYHGTMSDWRKPTVPFNLYHKPKDVVMTNPHIMQAVYNPPKDIRLLEEPRVIETQRAWGDMSFATPAVRSILLNVTYPRLRGVAEKERVKEVPPAPANPFTLPAWRPSRVSPEWRMRSASWDRGALRADCSHTQMFWTRPRRTDLWKRTADEI